MPHRKLNDEEARLAALRRYEVLDPGLFTEIGVIGCVRLKSL